MHTGKSQSEHIDEFHKLSYGNFKETLLYGQDTLKLEDVLATLNSRELQKMTEAKGDGGEEFIEELLDWIMDSGGSYYMTYKRDYLFDFKEYDGGNILLGDGRKCRVRGTCKVQVQMMDGSSFVLDNVRKTLKGRKQLGEYQTEWKIKTGNSGLSKVFWAEDTTMSTYLVNTSPSLAIRFKTPIDMLGGIVGNKLWTLDDVTLKVVLYKNMGFSESGEYKKTFIGSGVGTSSVQVLQGVEFEMEPQEDHIFEVESHGNVDHVAGSHEIQTQDLMDYHSAREGEQHSRRELFGYREDNNEAAFAVAVMDKINVHESLTFNYTVACEVIFKWKAGLKEDMDARSDVDQSGNTLRVLQSRFYNEKLVQTFLEGHSLLSLEGSLSEYYDVEKNDQSQAAYMTLTEAAKEAIWLKGLTIESGFELKIIVGIAKGALSKAILGLRFQHRLNLLSIDIG
ncbi:hypothetical protein Tco_0958371 [Tanacetum coccineum]